MTRLLAAFTAVALLAGCSETDPRLILKPQSEVLLRLAPDRVRLANLYGYGPPLTPLVLSPTQTVAGADVAASAPRAASTILPVTASPLPPPYLGPTRIH